MEKISYLWIESEGRQVVQHELKKKSYLFSVLYRKSWVDQSRKMKALFLLSMFGVQNFLLSSPMSVKINMFHRCLMSMVNGSQSIALRWSDLKKTIIKLTSITVHRTPLGRTRSRDVARGVESGREGPREWCHCEPSTFLSCLLLLKFDHPRKHWTIVTMLALLTSDQFGEHFLWQLPKK